MSWTWNLYISNWTHPIATSKTNRSIFFTLWQFRAVLSWPRSHHMLFLHHCFWNWKWRAFLLHNRHICLRAWERCHWMQFSRLFSNHRSFILMVRWRIWCRPREDVFALLFFYWFFEGIGRIFSHDCFFIIVALYSTSYYRK